MSESMNLRKLVSSVLDESDALTPSELAAEVASKVPSRQVRFALSEALEPYVRQVMQQSRNRPADQRSHEAHSGLVGGARSSKVAAIRHWSRKQLRERYHAGHGEWKFLGDFTYEDLVFAAEERRAHAEKNLARAAQFDALADLVQQRGVTTVGDLADTDLEAVAA